jgi:replicative DNA helicase
MPDMDIARGLKEIPHSYEAEQAVLGSLLLDNELWSDLSEILREEDFYTGQHRLIFRSIEALLSKAEGKADILTLSQYLSDAGLLTDAGGRPYLAELLSKARGSSRAIAYAGVIRDKSVARQLINVGAEMSKLAYGQGTRDIQSIVGSAEELFLNVVERADTGSRGPVLAKDVVNEVLTTMQQRAEDYANHRLSDVTGISTGFVDLDRMTKGFHGGELIIIAARPAMGKSAFGMNIVQNIVLNEEYRKKDTAALVFSLEMPARQIVTRLISSVSYVSQDKLERGAFEKDDYMKVIHAAKLINSVNLFIDDGNDLTPSELRARARKLAREHKLGIILIDYLQLMRGSGKYRDNRALEIGEISRSMKILAKEMNIPVVALAQLNRGVEGRTDKRPMNADLRESGAIEQDADVIMFIYREEVYKKDDPNLKGKTEIIIGKQRNGPIGTVNLIFNPECARFSSVDTRDYGPGPETGR